ncbi:hypothetical protein ACEQ8H_007928 [Pleosporales sp. CAS-2024a]
MSTRPDSAASNHRLSPSWMRRATVSIPWKKTEADSRPSTPNGLLSPDARPATSRTNSEDSHSERAKSLDGRNSFRGVVNRLRSSSSATSLGGKPDDNDIHDWWQGFRRYNQLVTTQFSPAPSYHAQEFARATKTLTKNGGGKLIHGLPEAAFDFSLLWCPVGELVRRDANEPTWSWTAYASPVTFPFDPTTCPDLFRIPKSEGDLFRSEIKNFHIGPPDAQYTVRRDKSSLLRTKYPPYFHAPRGHDASAESNTLRFEAETVSADEFTCEQLHHTDQHDNEKDIPVCDLYYRNHSHGDSTKKTDSKQHVGVVMDYFSNISAPSSDGPFEFVLLSRTLHHDAQPGARYPAIPTFHPPGTPMWDGTRFSWNKMLVEHDETLPEGEWKMLNVMMIKWVGEYAERVAIARIHEDVWKKLNPARKDIVLR